MAEEDEIDVLGDFNLDNLLSKNNSNIYECAPLVSQNSELLNCDYTIHPQWLLDKPSANPDNWYDTNLSTELLQKSQTDNDLMGLVSTENSITDESGWTEKEKNLLDRGIEIFGKSNVRLSQFIGSKTASEVKYYLKNFYMENQNPYKVFSENVVEDVNDGNLVAEVLNDTQIPASIEEVIAAVSTAKPTVQINNKKGRKKNPSFTDSTFKINSKDIPSGHSLLKSNYAKSVSFSPNQDGRLKNMDPNKKFNKKKDKSVKFKIKTKLKNHLRAKHEHLKKPFQKTFRTTKQKIITNSKIEITTGKGLAVPICEGEEIVKLKKVEDNSDVDIDIDVEDSDTELETPRLNLLTPILKPAEKNLKEKLKSKEEIKTETPCIENETNMNIKSSEIKERTIDLSSLDKSTVEQLMTLEEPKSEVTLKENEVSELEKVIHVDFFEGRPTKTPTRYLKIRQHIINTWLSQKPNYVTKTSVRSGLKNCGDVNRIGRVHTFLEQIGVINFGCQQMSYIRPLCDIIPAPSVKEKTLKATLTKSVGDSISERQRNKKKFTNDGEGGCTLTHDEAGHVISTTVINEEPAPKQRFYIKKPTIRLVYCRPFTDGKQQPYKVKIHLSALLTMDFHAHTSLTEVMGLVAGYRNPQNKTLTITHYEACRNVASSATHCDMCPISQANASDKIYRKGFDILGWFHSHPTFAPEPSHQDLETQQAVQRWIGLGRPCLGVILSPFSLNGALISSPFRCMMVDKKVNFEDQTVPYKFKVDLIAEGIQVDEFLANVREIFRSERNGTNGLVEFKKPYFQDSSISYLDKFISSVRMHLAKCGTMNKMTCDAIIQGIVEICSEEKLV